MGYRKKYEDSYLDEEEEEFDGSDLSDGQKLVRLIQKEERTDVQRELLVKLTNRLVEGAKLPGIPGAQAVDGIGMAVGAYVGVGSPEKAVELSTRLMAVAEAMGNRDLYYKASDMLGELL